MFDIAQEQAEREGGRREKYRKCMWGYFHVIVSLSIQKQSRSRVASSTALFLAGGLILGRLGGLAVLVEEDQLALA